MDLNLNRLVRSATAGSAGEEYCAYILDSLEVVDFSDWPIPSIEALWARAAASPLTVSEFIQVERQWCDENLRRKNGTEVNARTGR